MGTAVLFDFFGTFVAHKPGSASSAARCANLVNSVGDCAGAFNADRFGTAFGETFGAYAARPQAGRREFSMDDVITGFVRPILDREPFAVELPARLT